MRTNKLKTNYTMMDYWIFLRATPMHSVLRQFSPLCLSMEGNVGKPLVVHTEIRRRVCLIVSTYYLLHLLSSVSKLYAAILFFVQLFLFLTYTWKMPRHCHSLWHAQIDLIFGFDVVIEAWRSEHSPFSYSIWRIFSVLCKMPKNGPSSNLQWRERELPKNNFTM